MVASMESSVEDHAESSENVGRRMRDDVEGSPNWDVEEAISRQAQPDDAEGMPWVGRGTAKLEVGEK